MGIALICAFIVLAILLIWVIDSKTPEGEDIFSEIRKIKYKDKVKITSGFYEGQTGEIIGEYCKIGWDSDRFAVIYGWPVRLSNSEIKNINQFDLERLPE